MLVYLCKVVAVGCILRLAGFVRVTCTTTGVTGWYRNASTTTAKDEPQTPHPECMPIVFFHGIAPAGVLLYIPMLIFGLLSRDRPCLLVDHPNISCTLTFDALTEQETVQGVKELIESCFPNPTAPLTVCGHSFGSCAISWLLHDDYFRNRIRLCVLLDPVTILLSDPSVMINFLYSREVSSIRMVASSELFTEYYLRRHFSWYNSELWLDEVLSECDGLHAIVSLSEKDEIVDAPKVKRHVDLVVQRQLQNSSVNSNNNNNVHQRLRTLYWENSSHASCVINPHKWRDLRAAMLQSELNILQTTK